jgi:hypothetical protein
MDILLTAIVTWLSINLALPAVYDHPRIEYTSPDKMHAVRVSAETPSGSSGPVLQAGHTPRRHAERNVEALYDDRSRTIHLPEGWRGATPAELSVLVHEMVHHLQNIAGLKYECPEAREKPAYVAQDRWLALFGRNLIDEFKLDPMTVLVRTKCMH